MEYNEFSAMVRGGSKRSSPTQKSFTTRDIYERMRREKTLNVSRESFHKIIGAFNILFTECLLSGDTVVFPGKFGQLSLKKRILKPSITDGVLHIPQSVDWKRTISLWYEDKESYDKKTLVRNEGTDIYNIFYNKRFSYYPNVSYMCFKPSRSVKKRLSENIRRNKLDALGYGKRDY